MALNSTKGVLSAAYKRNIETIHKNDTNILIKCQLDDQPIDLIVQGKDFPHLPYESVMALITRKIGKRSLVGRLSFKLKVR